MGRGKVVAGHQQPLDPRRGGASQHLVAIGVERRILQVTMRVDQPVQSVGGAGAAQEASSTGSSVRGKSGSASPTCQPVATEPQAVSCSNPGPPAPRSSYGAGTPSWACSARAVAGVNGATRWPRIRQVSAITESTIATLS